MSDGPEEVLQQQLRLLARLEASIRVMREILEPAVQGAALEAERRLKSSPRAFEDLDSLASQVTDSHAWRLIREELELVAARARMDYGSVLEQALTNATIQWSGAFPSYKLWGSTRLDIDVATGRVKLGRRALEFVEPQEIVRAVISSRTGRSEPAPASGDFAGELQTAYASAAEGAGVSQGDYVSVGKIYDGLKKRMPRGYSRDRFARDLAAVAASGEIVEFAPSRHPRHGIRVPPGDGALVGSLRLRQP